MQTLEEELGAALSSGAGPDDSAQQAEPEAEFTDAERKAYEKVMGKPMKKAKKKKGEYDDEDMLLNILPNPIRCDLHFA